MKLEITADEYGELRIIAHEQCDDIESAQAVRIRAVRIMAALKIPSANLEISSVTVSERNETK